MAERTISQIIIIGRLQEIEKIIEKVGEELPALQPLVNNACSQELQAVSFAIFRIKRYVADNDPMKVPSIENERNSKQLFPEETAEERETAQFEQKMEEVSNQTNYGG